MHERWLSAAEIAAHLGVKPDTIYKWIDRKKMPVNKLSWICKLRASEGDGWVKGGLAAQKPTRKPRSPAEPSRRPSKPPSTS